MALDHLGLIGGGYVVAADPGDGKSRHVRERLAERLADGESHRVLYVVRETVKEDSPGAEARDHFLELSRTVSIVRGRRHFDGPTAQVEYEAQLDWASGDEIKIISHGHLPALLTAQPATLLGRLRDGSTTLVIDEDPTDSLVLPGTGWKVATLQKLKSPGRIVQALIALGSGVAWKHHSKKITSLKGAVTYRWTNTTFWQALHRELGALTPRDLEDFGRDLLQAKRSGQRSADDIDGRLMPAVAEQIARTFEEDYNTSGATSQRFNLKFSDGPDATFNAYVLVPWTLPHFLLLDAYADEQHYERLFGPSLAYHVPIDRKALTVQSAPALALDEHNILNGKQSQQLRNILLEIKDHQQARGKKVLILVKKSIRECEPFQTAWREVFGVSATSDEITTLDDEVVTQQHWMSGRGSNNYYDHDIFALTYPHINKAIQDEDLAALAPSDPGIREQLYAHKQRTEVLQMLHRGRQPHILKDAPTIVLAWPEQDSADYAYRVPFIKGTQTPLWIRHVTHLVAESVKEMGGFSLDLLLGSPLVKGGRLTPQLTPQVRDWLSHLPASSLLRKTLLDGVCPSGVDAISWAVAKKHLEVIAKHLGLVAFGVDAAPYGFGGAHEYVMYVPEGLESTHWPVRIFERFLPDSSQTLSRRVEDMI